jgi:hypothetical protein
MCIKIIFFIYILFGKKYKYEIFLIQKVNKFPPINA